MNFNSNRGHVWAEYLHENEIITPGMSSTQILEILDEVMAEHNPRMLENMKNSNSSSYENFYEDFCYALSEDFGYENVY